MDLLRQQNLKGRHKPTTPHSSSVTQGGTTGVGLDDPHGSLPAEDTLWLYSMILRSSHELKQCPMLLMLVSSTETAPGRRGWGRGNLGGIK